MGYICTGGEGSGVSMVRETQCQFDAIEGPGAAGSDRVEVGRRSPP
jgi:hypothetical protein